MENAMSDDSGDVRTRDIPGPEKDLLTASVIDVAGCDRVEISVGLTEFDKKPGHRMETWPEAVRGLIERQLAEWQARHSDRVIRCVTSAVAERCCVVVIHHSGKAAT
jgi:hypothetical protein